MNYLLGKTEFSRIQNLHISQTEEIRKQIAVQFSRIQNLHISQTIVSKD